MDLDRAKAGNAAFVRALFPRRLYLVQYGGVVVAQSGDNSFDFQPDDERIPGVSGVPLKLPAPGVTVTVDVSQRPRALLGWANGDPAKPELRLWESPGLAELAVQASALVSLDAAQVKLGAAAVDAIIKGTTFQASFNTWSLALDVILTALGAPLAILPGVPPLSTYLAASASMRAAAYLSTKSKTE